MERTHPNCVFLRGNHEQMLIDARRRYDPTFSGVEDTFVSQDAATLWFANGGSQTLQSYRRRFGENDRGRWYEAIPDDHWEFFLATQMEWQSNRYHFVHAGLVPTSARWSEPDYDPRLWIREPFISSKADFGRIVVYGHTPLRSGKPWIQANKIGIDTAAAYGGPLTCIALDDDTPYAPAHVQVIQA